MALNYGYTCRIITSILLFCIGLSTKLSQISLRITPEFSPIPAANTNASIPSIMVVYAPIVFFDLIDKNTLGIRAFSSPAVALFCRHTCGKSNFKTQIHERGCPGPFLYSEDQSTKTQVIELHCRIISYLLSLGQDAVFYQIYPVYPGQPAR